MTILAADNFTRANQSGFGTSTGPNSGQAWTLNTGSGWTITSNSGRANSSSDDVYLLGSGTQGDVEGYCQSVQINTSAGDWFGPALRYTASTWTGYLAITYADQSKIGVTHYSNGTRIDLATASFTYTANHVYAVRFRATGNTNPRLQVRIWDTNGSEPSTWNIDFTDSGANKITAAGQYGLYASDGTSGDIKFTSASFNDTLSSGTPFSSIATSDSFSTISPGGGIFGS
jgi:hypothetical protein